LKYSGFVSGKFPRKNLLYSFFNAAIASTNDSVTVAIKSPIEQKQITEGLKYGSRIIFPVSIMISKEMLRGMKTDLFLEQLAYNMENHSSFLTFKRA
jgi:hypothetical protein